MVGMYVTMKGIWITNEIDDMGCIIPQKQLSSGSEPPFNGCHPRAENKENVRKVDVSHALSKAEIYISFLSAI